jgi:hypothetical protein
VIVCPVECIPLNPAKIETEAVLREKYLRLQQEKDKGVL